MRAGDFVIIQFGHNDAGALNQEPPGSTRPLRARGTIPGIGNESEEIDNVITGKHETVYTFGWYLRKMIADTRAKGATPILLTLTKTQQLEDGRIACPADTYRQWTWQTAQSEKVAFVDLTRIIADRYQREGAGSREGAVHRRHGAHQHRRRRSQRARRGRPGCARSRRCRSQAMLSRAGRQIKRRSRARQDRSVPRCSRCSLP